MSHSLCSFCSVCSLISHGNIVFRLAFYLFTQPSPHWKAAFFYMVHIMLLWTVSGNNASDGCPAQSGFPSDVHNSIFTTVFIRQQEVVLGEQSKWETGCFFPSVCHWSFGIMTLKPPPPQPNGFSCKVPFPPFLLLTSFVSLRSGGLRLSNRDCACLRLSRGFKLGSYPSWAIQPSILAWYRRPTGHGCYEGRGNTLWLWIFLGFVESYVNSSHNCGLFSFW